MFFSFLFCVIVLSASCNRSTTCSVAEGLPNLVLGLIFLTLPSCMPCKSCHAIPCISSLVSLISCWPSSSGDCLHLILRFELICTPDFRFSCGRLYETATRLLFWCLFVCAHSSQVPKACTTLTSTQLPFSPCGNGYVQVKSAML